MQLLHLPGAGVEVRGVDLTADLSAADVAALRAAYDEHHLLVFRDQPLSDERHVEVAGLFGPVMPYNGSAVGWVSNVVAGAAVPTGPLLFHSDFAFLPVPLFGLSLNAQVIPSAGAETLFADACAAVEQLSPALRRSLDGARSRNVSAFRVDFASRQREDEIDPREVEALHLAIAIHPRLRRPVLMVNESHSVRLIEFSRAGSERALDEVFAVLYAPDNVYEHRWRVGDFVIWDNLAVQHGRRDFDPAEPRTLRRVVLGSGPEFVLTPELVELYKGAR